MLFARATLLVHVKLNMLNMYGVLQIAIVYGMQHVILACVLILASWAWNAEYEGHGQEQNHIK